MLPDSPPAAARAPDLPASTPAGLVALFVAFAKISLVGFGGVLVWARRGIVDQHRWMTADEFNETYALCHFLPGPMVVNLSVVFGSRFRGIAGGIAAFAGLLGPPVVIVTILAALYARFGEIEALRRILAGVSCAAVGLLFSAIFRMMRPLIRKRDPVALALLAAVFAAVWPLWLASALGLLVSIAPCSGLPVVTPPPLCEAAVADRTARDRCGGQCSLRVRPHGRRRPDAGGGVGWLRDGGGAHSCCSRAGRGHPGARV